MKELNIEELNKIQKRASDKAIKINRALGLPYLVVRNDQLIKIDKEGNEKVIGRPEFGTRRISKSKINLKSSE
jgi:hypothetical protein